MTTTNPEIKRSSSKRPKSDSLAFAANCYSPPDPKSGCRDSSGATNSVMFLSHGASPTGAAP